MIGICQPYTGTICQDFLKKKNIFIEVDNVQSNIETKLKHAIKNIENFPYLSPKCKPFVLPLMCHHLFPYCESNSQPKPSYICREDCFRIQRDFCPTEHLIAEYEKLTGSILFPSCRELPESNQRCMPLRSVSDVTGKERYYKSRKEYTWWCHLARRVTMRLHENGLRFGNSGPQVNLC